MACTKRHCLGCKRFVSFRTICRHLKHGCDRQRRRHSRLLDAADAIIERAAREGQVRLAPNPRPPTRPSRHYNRREPPRNPPPAALRARLARQPSDPPSDLPRRSPELDNPDFGHDTPGAGPGPTSRNTSPRFARRPSPLGERGEDAPYTLRDAFPWLENLNAEEYLVNQFLSQLIRTGDHKLPHHQKLFVQAFNMKVSTDITGISYSKLRRAFPDRLGDLPTEAKLCTRIGSISGLDGSPVDCCVNSCVAFTGDYKDEVICPYCPEPRYKTDPRSGRRVAQRQFQYIPIIPRLIAYYRNPLMARKMRYRSERQTAPDSMSDIFDGSFYRQLLDRRVTVGAETLGHRYFSKPTDVAFGLSTDGFGPFKSRKQTCWPLILFNYNLPPSIRTQLQHILCIGVIPGPNAPKELATYLEPLINELEDLARGIPAFDVIDGHTFALRAYLLAAFGDMPAAAKLMSMKGPNGKFPCRACKIEGINPGGSGRNRNTLYTPLSRPFAPHTSIRRYDPLNLLRRSHADHIQQALNVQGAVNNAAEQVLSRDTGVNGLSPLARLASLEFPTSFPHDFMHLMFENILPTLIGLWTRRGRWKNFGTNNEDYRLSDEVWTAIGAACAQSGDTIPAAFGCRVPNLEAKPREVTSESMLLFATLLGPAVLHRRFVRPRYYHHFVRLVKLIKLCLGLTVQRAEIGEICEGLAKWVQDYERFYYRNVRSRLAACTLPLHALLHVADDIEAMGPVWCYWAFPMERFCGALARANKSRRYPYTSMNQYVLQLSQLSQIKHCYGLGEELDLNTRQENIATDFIATQIPVSAATIRDELLDRPFVAWGKMQRIVKNYRGDVIGGDLIRGHHIVSGNAESRDASHVKYWSVNSHWRWSEGPAVVLEEETFGYGRAEQFIVIDAAFLRQVTEAAGVFYPHINDLVLAVISPIPYLRYSALSGTTEYGLRAGNYVSPEIIDATKVDGLVGRVKTPLGESYILQRDTAVGQMDMLDKVINPD
ncbi:hypothetical protein FRC07_007398 [Ceratobasidium sp. 392]|nr:hypothetical protein FRC07_007398 [Ceratobasidium sp. 392]